MYWPASAAVPNTPGFAHSQPHSPAQSHSQSHPSPASSASSYHPSRSVSPANSVLDDRSLPQKKDDNEREAWTALQSAQTGDVLRTVLRGRKTWKSDRNGSTIWPLELEAALLEGLELYVPDDSRETRMLGRFPRRNRFIADHIRRVTGQLRTPKQVGSRLQQLRESCGGQRLMHLLSPFREPPPSPTSTVESSLGSPTMTAAFAGNNLEAAPHTIIPIDILNEQTGPGSLHSANRNARPISQINPLCTFSSLNPLSAHARFTVLSESAGLMLHAETVPLELRADIDAPSGYFYSARLVPRYWNVIVQSPDPTRFTIFQEIVKDDSAASVLFTATYRFRYPSPMSTDEFGSPTASLVSLPELGYDTSAYTTSNGSSFGSSDFAGAVTGGWPSSAGL